MYLWLLLPTSLSYPLINMYESTARKRFCDIVILWHLFLRIFRLIYCAIFWILFLYHSINRHGLTIAMQCIHIPTYTHHQRFQRGEVSVYCITGNIYTRETPTIRIKQNVQIDSEWHSVVANISGCSQDAAEMLEQRLMAVEWTNSRRRRA